MGEAVGDAVGETVGHPGGPVNSVSQQYNSHVVLNAASAQGSD